MRKSSWIWIVAGWFFIVRVSEYYTLRTDMGRGLTWADNGKPFDYTLWFTDIYVRAPAGWRYVFGQSSLPLPRTPE